MASIQSYEPWRNCKTYDDLCACNIVSLDGTIENPYYYSDGTPILDEDTMPFMDTIININKRGFMTWCSQPSLIDDSYTEKLFKRDMGYRTKDGDNIYLTKDGLFRTVQIQKGWCDGYMPNNILQKFIPKIKNLGYDVYYVSHVLGPEGILVHQENDTKKRINVTYITNGETRHEATNIHSVEGLEREICINLSRSGVSSDLIESVRLNASYVCVLDKDFNTGKNIYGDVLSCL